MIDKHVVRYTLCVYVNFCDKVALLCMPIMAMDGPLGRLVDFAFLWTLVRTMSLKDMIGM